MVSHIQRIERATVAARHIAQQIFILTLGGLTKTNLHIQPRKS
jgi:hypothetical protein